MEKSGGLVRTGTSGGDLLGDSVSILTPPLTLLSILQVDAGLLSTVHLTLLLETYNFAVSCNEEVCRGCVNDKICSFFFL